LRLGAGLAFPETKRAYLVRVVPREDEDFEKTLDRFRHAVHKAYERPWHKRRYGYYEKPSTLRRKQNRTKQATILIAAHRGSTNLRLCINLEDQFRREGPSNSMGR